MKFLRGMALLAVFVAIIVGITLQLSSDASAPCGSGATVLGPRCIDPWRVLLVVGTAVAALGVLPRARNYWLEFCLAGVAILFLAAGALFIFGRPEGVPSSVGSATDAARMRMKVSDLGGITSVVQSNPRSAVTLVIETTDAEGHPREFGELQILAAYAADGHTVTDPSETPENVVLLVPEAQVDAIAAAMQHKKSAYVRPQAAPTAMRSPVPSPWPAGIAAFTISLAKTQSDISAVMPGPVQVLIVVDKEVHCYEATLDAVLDARGAPLESPYRAPASVRVLVQRDGPDRALFLERDLAGATGVAVVPRGGANCPPPGTPALPSPSPSPVRI